MFIMMLMFVFVAAGCFAAQRDEINAKFDNQGRSLDAQCRSNMTDWCLAQYQILENRRGQELNDLSQRRRAFADAMSEAGRNMSNNSNNTIRCTSTTYGNVINTNCR
jgi:hypothetical protein